MSQFCKSCHYENLDIAIFCANCGNKLEINTDKNKSYSNNYTKKQNIDIEFKILLIFTVVFIVISFVIIKYNSTSNIINDTSSRAINKDIVLEASTKEKNKFWKCKVKWIIYKGEKFRPTNENLQEISIEIINKMDALHLKTQNGESKYKYISFIDLNDSNLGIEYIYENRFIGIFQDKNLFLGDITKGIDANYYCKDMILDITKLSSLHSKKIFKTDIKPITPVETITKVITKPTISIQKFSLSIQKTPSNAKVRILNIKPKYYDGIKLKKGKYHIEVSKKGYETTSKWIDLRKDMTFTIILTRLQENSKKNTFIKKQIQIEKISQYQQILPVHAKIDYTGHRWECRNGYYKSSNQCLEVQIPRNAKIDYTGHRWECRNGYYKSGNQCISVGE